jgi:GldM C-terminal domain
MKNILAKIPSNLAFLCLGMSISSIFAFKILTELPSCAVMIEKENILYIGVDNPMKIVVQGSPLDQVKVAASEGLTLVKTGDETYNVTCKTLSNDAFLTVTVGESVQKFPYRVKRIPNPKILLSAKYDSRTMGNGDFKAQLGLAVVFENFNYDINCDIVSYKVVRVRKRQDPAEILNIGEQFTRKTLELVNAALPGDVYYFDAIKVSCAGIGGDCPGMATEDLIFKIK